MITYKKWSSSETDFIRDNHSILCDEALAVKLSQMTGQTITTAMVRRQRRKLALKKPRGRPSKNRPSPSLETSDSSATSN